jgi:cytochrome c-type biogenesis protein CcmF
MIIEIGHFALILALATAVVQSVVPLIGARRRDAGMMAVGPLAAVTSLMLVAISFFALTHAYVVSDFSVQNVVENSHSLKPMLYKITGVWGNHEGSMLLWVLILVLFLGAGRAVRRNLPDTLKANVLAVQAWITVAFLLFVVLHLQPVQQG